jgi:hypothetical protein
VEEGGRVAVASGSPASGVASSVAVFVGGGAVVAGAKVGVSVACAACPPQADKTIPVSKMIESVFFDMLDSFVQAHHRLDKQIIDDFPSHVYRIVRSIIR